MINYGIITTVYNFRRKTMHYLYKHPKPNKKFRLNRKRIFRFSFHCLTSLILIFSIFSQMLVKAQVNYTVQSTTIADEAMRQLQQLRAKAWDDNLPYYGMTLQEYAKSVGVTSRDEYVYGPTWDSTCEANSQMRIEELFNTGQFDHRRPNGTYMSDFGFGEGLYAYTNPIYLGEAMYDWGYAEIPDLKSVNGKFTEANSHLHNLIDPEYKAFSFAILNINDGSYNYAVFHASYDQGDQSFLGDDTIYYQDEAATTTTKEPIVETTTQTYSTETPLPATPAPEIPVAEEGEIVEDADLEAAIIDALENPTLETNPETTPTETPQDSSSTDTTNQAVETTQAEVAPETTTEVTPTTESATTTVATPSKPSSTDGDVPSRPITNTSTRPTGTGITKPQSKILSTPTMPKQSSSTAGSSSSSSNGGTSSGSNKESHEESSLESESQSADETNQEDESQEPYLIDLVECYELSLTSLDYVKTMFMSAF